MSEPLFLASVPDAKLVAVPVDVLLGVDGSYPCPLCGLDEALVVRDGRAFCFGCGAKGCIEGQEST